MSDQLNDQSSQEQPLQQQSQQQGSSPQSDQVLHNQLDAARHIAEQQVDQAIEQFAQKIPGGTEHVQQAENAASGILDKLEGELEQEAEKRMGNLGGTLGGLFGHHKEEQGS